mgnify:CR=1 FL=1
MVEEISSHIRLAMFDSLNDRSAAVGRFKVGETFIEIDYSHPYASKLPTVVTVTAPSEREYPRVEEYIAHHLPDWFEVMKESEKAEVEEREFQDYLWSNCRW